MSVDIQNRKRTIRNLVIFTVALMVISWLAWLLAFSDGNEDLRGLGLLIWLVSPLAISLLLRAFAGDGWRDIGIKPNFKGNIGWYLLSIFIYPLAVAPILLIGVALGGISFINFSAGQMMLFVSALGFGFIGLFVKNIFEEFTWRGYLVPKMFSLGINDMAAHLMVGAIWAAWHIPYYLGLLNPAELQGYTSLNLAVFIPLSFVGIAASSIAYNEIRLITGSTWPAVLMHAVSNIFVNTLILDGYIQMSASQEIWFTPGMGILSIVVIVLIGIGLYGWRMQKMKESVISPP